MTRDRACLSLGDGALGQGACFWGGRSPGPQANIGEAEAQDHSPTLGRSKIHLLVSQPVQLISECQIQ